MIYWGQKYFFTLVFKLLFGLEIKGRDKVPPMGRLVVAANHVNFWDPVLVGAAMPRKIHFMAKEELFRHPVFSWIIRQMAAFPVKRGAPDRDAIRYAQNLLESGQIVAIFPEGTRQDGTQLGEPHGGMAFIAARNQAPILPIAIYGTHDLRPFRSRVRIAIGEPIEFDTSRKMNKGDLAELSRTVMNKIANLRESIS